MLHHKAQVKASFSMEDFAGNGFLKELLPKLLEDGWDDVPTLKLMNAEDMNAINMTQVQKDALEIRTYLHDRGLMQYSDKLEASGKDLPELLRLSTTDLSAQFGMRRGHIARFLDRTKSPCGSGTNSLPVSRRRASTGPSRKGGSSGMQSSSDVSNIKQFMADYKIKDGHVLKEILASMPEDPRSCGCLQPSAGESLLKKSFQTKKS